MRRLIVNEFVSLDRVAQARRRRRGHEWRLRARRLAPPMIDRLVLGGEKPLFGDSQVTTTGAILATYARAEG
jgi:hypothetical protein